MFPLIWENVEFLLLTSFVRSIHTLTHLNFFVFGDWSVSLKPDLFEGMRFDFTKMLNQKFSLNHRYLLLNY